MNPPVAAASESRSGCTTAWKADLHIHSAEDPHDEVDYSAIELLQRAHELGFDVLAITLHDHVLSRPEVLAVAESFGIWLISAAEMRLEGADVVILNLTEEEAIELRTLEDLRSLRKRRGRSILVFAPHPFYVLGGSIGSRLETYLDCFDAIEYCHFHTRGWNLNRDAERIAHRLDFFGEHYSLVHTQSKPTVEEFFDAIRAGNFDRNSPAWPWSKFLFYLLQILVVHPIRVLLVRF